MVEKPRHIGDNLLDCRSESDSIEEGKMRHDFKIILIKIIPVEKESYTTFSSRICKFDLRL